MRGHGRRESASWYFGRVAGQRAADLEAATALADAPKPAPPEPRGRPYHSWSADEPEFEHWSEGPRAKTIRRRHRAASEPISAATAIDTWAACYGTGGVRRVRPAGYDRSVSRGLAVDDSLAGYVEETDGFGEARAVLFRVYLKNQTLAVEGAWPYLCFLRALVERLANPKTRWRPPERDQPICGRDLEPERQDGAGYWIQDRAGKKIFRRVG